MTLCPPSKAFAFSAANALLAQQHIAKYPSDRSASAVLPLLDLAQRQNNGWLSKEALDYVAHYLGMPPIRVYEVASFYSMFHLSPVGKHHLQVCGTTPCWLRGAGDIMKACSDHLGIRKGEVTADGLFSIEEVECLGACANAPVIQINDDYYEDLTVSSALDLIESLKAGASIRPGSQTGRHGSEPVYDEAPAPSTPAKKRSARVSS